jgi:hypothetical protein
MNLSDCLNFYNKSRQGFDMGRTLIEMQDLIPYGTKYFPLIHVLPIFGAYGTLPKGF